MVVAISTSCVLLTKVKERQRASGLNDNAFSALLNIERSSWTHIKRGRRYIGLTLLKAITRTYPDLDDEVLRFLRDGHDH